MQTKLTWVLALAAALLALQVAPGAAAASSPVPPECQASDLSPAAQARCDFIARTPDICQRQGLSEDTQRWCDQIRFADEKVPPECQQSNLSAADQARCDFIARTPNICQRQGLSEDTQRWCDQRRFAGEPLYNVVRLAADGAVRSVHLIETETGREVLTAYPYGRAFAVPRDRDREIRIKVDSLAGFLEGRPTPGHVGRTQRTEMDFGPIEHDETNRRAKGPQLAALDPASSPILNDATPGPFATQLAQTSSSPPYAVGLPIGWNGSTGISSEQCLNYTIEPPSNAKQQQQFKTTNTASSIAGQTNVSATVKGTVDAFSASDTFSFSDAWQSSANSTSQYFNFYSLYSLTTAIDRDNPLTTAGQDQQAAGNFATACGTEYLSTVPVGMLATISINYGSSSQATQTMITNSFNASTGLDSIQTAVSTAKSQTNSSSYFIFSMNVDGGGTAFTELNTQYAKTNGQNVPYYASCAAGNVNDCGTFEQNMIDGATAAFNDFDDSIKTLDGQIAEMVSSDLSFLETFPSGIADVDTDVMVPTSIPISGLNDVLSQYKDALDTYVKLLNQISTLNNRVGAPNVSLLALLKASPGYNAPNLLDLVGYLERLQNVYTTDRQTLLDNLNKCLNATDDNVTTVCKAISDNQSTTAFKFYENSPQSSQCYANNDCFFVQENTIALQYAADGQGTVSGEGSVTLFDTADTLYIDKLPPFTAAGSNIPIAGQAAFVNFIDRPPAGTRQMQGMAIVALQPAKPISTANLSPAIDDGAGKFTMWWISFNGAEPTLTHVKGAFFTSNACSPTFAEPCAIDYQFTYSPLAGFDVTIVLPNRQIEGFFTPD